MTEFNSSEPTTPDSNPFVDSKLSREFEKTGPSNANYKTYKPSGKGMGALKKWLGPKGYKQFQRNLCQSISTRIKKDEANSAKAARKLKASEQGKDPSEVE